MSYQAANTSVDAAAAKTLLARIDYADRHVRDADPCRFTVGLPLLNGEPLAEFWNGGPVADRGWDGAIGYASTANLLMAHCLAEDADKADLAEVSFELYRNLLGFIGRAGYRFPLRVWNLIDAIHDESAGLERYRSFSVGRARAFDEAQVAKESVPAASAIGSQAPGLFVYLIAAREPGLAVENPRQVPAYHYPSDYGPRPPYFARATCANHLQSAPLFISGTASVVDHRSVHADSLEKQTEETLRNLDSLLAATDMPLGSRPAWIKAYLRSPHVAADVEPLIRRWAGPQATILFLRGDICRKELEIEIEAFALGDDLTSGQPGRP